jgi:hypothetical protein
VKSRELLDGGGAGGCWPGTTDHLLAVNETDIRRYTMMAERAQASESNLWEAAGIVSGAVVADVGCGPAAVAVRMAQVVGPGGRVSGVEPDPAALAATQRMLEQATWTTSSFARGRQPTRRWCRIRSMSWCCAMCSRTTELTSSKSYRPYRRLPSDVLCPAGSGEGIWWDGPEPIAVKYCGHGNAG